MGALCSFDAFLAKYRLDDPAYQQLAAIARGADSLRLEPMVQALPDRNTQLSSQDPVTQRSSSAHDPTGSPSLCRARWHCLTIVCRTDRPSPLGPVCHFVPVPSRSLKKWGAPPVRNRASVRNGGALVRVANAYKQCLQHSSTAPPEWRVGAPCRATTGRECEVDARAERGHLDAPFPPVPDVGDFLIE